MKQLTWDEMKALEGKRVRVQLDSYGDPVYVEGVLHSIDEYGQVALFTPDHGTRFSWPALNMEEL